MNARETLEHFLMDWGESEIKRFAELVSETRLDGFMALVRPSTTVLVGSFQISKQQRAEVAFALHEPRFHTCALLPNDAKSRSHVTGYALPGRLDALSATACTPVPSVGC